MKTTLKLLLFSLLLSGTACSFFGEKNKVSDYIQKPDYSLKSVEYVPIFPTFGSGIVPVSLYAGYDQLLYAVDSARAILSFDAAGNLLGRFDLPGVYFVIQNRSLDLYALGRMDTVINNLSYNLPVLYKISQKNAAEGGTGTVLNLSQARIEKKLVYPYCINETNKLTNKAAVEATRFVSIGFLDNNAYYVSSNGPAESSSELFITRRSSILTFSSKDVFQGGFSEGTIQPFGLTTLVQPPQRNRMETRKDFIYTSLNQDLGISVRYIEVLETPDGLFYNFKPLAQPQASQADGFLYQTFRFKKPEAVLFAGTTQRYIFVADPGKDSVFIFQENGFEGTIPPPQYSNRKLIRVSFGGTGSGPTQFIRPKALAFANRTLFVADAGNRRISRFILTSDYD